VLRGGTSLWAGRLVVACSACSVANPIANGSIIPVGAPTDAGKFLTLKLTGSVPVNECLCQCAAGDAGPCTTVEDTTQ